MFRLLDFRVLGRSRYGTARPIPLGGAKQRPCSRTCFCGPPAWSRRAADRRRVGGRAPGGGAQRLAVLRVAPAQGARRRAARAPAGGYVLHADPAEIDADRFGSLAAEARRGAAVDPAAAIELYREADGLWRGPALDDLADQPSLRGRDRAARGAANRGGRGPDRRRAIPRPPRRARARAREPRPRRPAARDARGHT